VGASFLSGIMLYAAFPSHDVSFLAWFALVPLFLIYARSKPFHGFLLSFVFGVVFYSGLFYWMFDLPKYNLLHHAVLGVYLCPLLGLFGWLFCITARRSGLNTALFSAPFMWIVIEYFRSNLSFLSLPWGLLGHSQYQHPVFIQIADVTGVYGISFLIVLVNAGLTGILHPFLLGKKTNYLAAVVPFSKHGRTAIVGFATIAFLANIIYGLVMTSKSIEGERINISVIQGNIEQSKKWDKKYAPVIMQIYAELTLKTAVDRPDLIVWPESATPKGIHRDGGIFTRLKKLARQAGVPILLGSSQLAKFKVTDPQKKAKHLNSAFLINPGSGRVAPQRYDKVRLLPFSEYLPYKDKIPWSYLNIPAGGSFIPGNKFKIFELPPVRFGVAICWENIFPDITRQFVKAGAQFIINITNEAWFGESAAPYQFLSMNVFRAVENRIFIVRCANTGISCFIDPCGRVVNRVKDDSGNDIFVRGVLNGMVIPLENKTFYMRYGDWFVWFCLIGLTLVFISALIKTRNAGKK